MIEKKDKLAKVAVGFSSMVEVIGYRSTQLILE